MRHFWRAAGLAFLGVALLTAPHSAEAKKAETSQSRKEPVPVSLSGDTPPALLAVDRKQWDIARSLAYASHNSHVKKAVDWYYFAQASEFPKFEVLAEFITKHPTFPQMDKLTRRAEIALLTSSLDKTTKRAWFEKHPPVTALGKLRFAELQDKADKDTVINAWVEGDLTHAEAIRISETYRQWIDRDAYTKRVDRLIWDEQASDAEDLFNYITPDYVPVAKARISLLRDSKLAPDLVNGIEKKYQQDKGLLYERMRYRLRRDDEVGAEEILLQISEEDDLPHADKWWPARKTAIREALQAGRYQTAARLANAHGVDRKDREELSEALFLQGWVSLVFIKDAKTGFNAFKELYDVVKFPISRSRAAYWAARAAEKLGNESDAKDWYEIAASYPTLFYGQIAHSHLHGDKPLNLQPEPTVSEEELKAFIDSNPVAAVTAGLIRSGGETYTMPFLRELARAAASPKEAAYAVALAKLTRRQDYVMRIAKEVWQEHQVMMTETSFPITPLPKNVPQDFDAALAYAIARQESLFYNQATSPVGARGLMQVMPSTGKLVAKKLGIDFTADDLYDPQTNLLIGSSYIHDLVQKFDGSMVMAIAGYNAGPGRPSKWAQTYGRPNGNLHQTINWIEMIPFNETRNYVMRVLENYQVYRAMLSAGKRAPNIKDAASR